MLDGIFGIRLVMLIGRSVPLPAPPTLTAALTAVEVTSDAQNGDGFSMTFSLSRQTPIDYSLLQDGLLDPPSRVILAVTLGVVPEVLIDGAITHHQLDPMGGQSGATLTVMGKAVSIMMDLEERNEQYPNQPDFVIVNRLIAGYARYGLVPLVTPTGNVPLMTERVPTQHETDLKYIERLARDNGFVFYIEPVTVGVNSAYWGPEQRAAVPQAALTVNMGSADNVTRLSFANDALAPIGTRGTFVEPFTRTAIPIPPLPSLKIPPLASRPAPALRTTLQRDTGNQNAGVAATSVVAAVTRAPDAVTASGEVDSVRYGHVLRARKLVGVRGVGFSYDGFYYVKSVTHSIRPGSYKQSFSLSREGTGSTSPVVIP